MRYHRHMKKYLNVALVTIIFIAISFGLYINVKKQSEVDRTRLPDKVALNRLFQRWVANLRKKGLVIEGDEFKLKEDNEIYNTTWMTISSIDNPGKKAEFDATLASHSETPGVVFAPSNTLFIDFRNKPRDNVFANQVRLYGLKEDKIIDARILDCSVRANCYFDRAYFLDNDVFVITEFSRNISKKDETVSICPATQSCTYTVKLHLVDLMHNKRYVYESKPFDIILSDWIPNL